MTRKEKAELEKAQKELEKRKKKKKDYQANLLSLTEKGKRKWMCKTGKSELLSFSDEQIRQLKNCFDSLDDDGGGSIGIDELQEPLIGLGFANSLDEVQDMVDAVDDDGSGCIEFPEFLGILKNSGDSESTKEMTTFFKKLTTGEIGSKDISFTLFVQRSKRKHLMNAIVGDKGSPEKRKGKHILGNIRH